MIEQPGPPNLSEKYDEMMRLADVFDNAGADMRARAGLGEQVLRDPAVSESAPLSPLTWERLDEDVRAATTGRHGLLARSVELDADALVVRATVLTYRWIDELRDAAYRTLGAAAGRALGYLAPEVALGGTLVAAGLIETDALDRDGVAAYLDELAEQHPDLMEHALGAGGLLDGLRMRSLLASPALGGDQGPPAARAGLAALGAEVFPVQLGAALRDIAGGALDRPADRAEDGAEEAATQVDQTLDVRPEGLAGLMASLFETTRSVAVRRVGPATYIVYLPGPRGHSDTRLRLVGGDHLPYADRAVRAIERAVRSHDERRARVLLVGHGQGGPTALDIAATADSPLFEVDRVVTAGAPSALVPRVPRRTRVLSLEDRTDPVALLGALVNAGADNRLTVVFDAVGAEGPQRYLTGALTADATSHPELRAEVDGLRELGYLA